MSNKKYCELVLSFLVEHGILDQVLEFHYQFPYISPELRVTSGGPINDLFDWNKTGNLETWSHYYHLQPNELRNPPTVIIKRLVEYLEQANKPNLTALYW